MSDSQNKTDKELAIEFINNNPDMYDFICMNYRLLNYYGDDNTIDLKNYWEAQFKLSELPLSSVTNYID